MQKKDVANFVTALRKRAGIYAEEEKAAEINL
jgi:hypothetical protein